MSIFVTLWAALLALLGLGIVLLWRKSHHGSALIPDTISHCGGVVILVAQGSSLVLLGCWSPLVWNMCLAFLVFGVLGWLSHRVPARVTQGLLCLGAAVCVPLHNNSTFIPGLGMVEMSRGFVILCDCLAIFATVSAVRTSAFPEGVLSGTFLGLWSVLFLFFSKTAFGAQWGWDYGLLEAISAAHVGALATFLIFNSAPALVGLGLSGAWGLAGGLAIFFCVLRCPLIIIGLLSVPLSQWIFIRKGLGEWLRKSGYSEWLLSPILSMLNTVIAASVLQWLDLLQL